ncbi:hypothetical protein HOLleu_03971 [Holothuria leucospilota]|uniref:Uncharacterized protein n=1 Tax=Holothuria leucospilota TaxID=206669 RepID=A0A9Q1CU57_HOLLE|nr:hypothetical protein HOLleu_03971 [Holothuria leucospilota]
MSTLSSLKSRDFEVWWNWDKDEPIYILNLQTGRWENKNDGSEPTEEDFERMLSEGAEDRKGWTEETYKGSTKVGREILRKLAEENRGELS